MLPASSCASSTCSAGAAPAPTRCSSATSRCRPIGHALADLATEVDAARMLTWRAAWLVATGQDALREITMAKLFASEVYVKAANLGVQVMGAYGLNAEFDMQRHFRDAKSATIAAGTSETQRNLIAG